MSRRLIAYVHVDGVPYGPDDQVPAKVAKRIGDHAWTDADSTVEVPTPTGAGDGSEDEAPPRSGRGSGVEAWRAYAEQHDVEVAAEASREEIIAACEAAELVEPEQPKE